ncbi:neutral/alkaline non-lysosomal ceramidase N-terminal domain-containing protein [bacterium]|nr:neutral/alkaline non-lysosomal ceramidase N-terminal domain-containing protein [bacterium]
MDKFIVGIGKVDITPPFNIPYLGFYPKRHDFFKGIHDPLYARSLYISDGKEEVIIISVDSIGFSNTLLGKKRNFTDEIREKIERKTGVKGKNVMISSSHIHSTPETIGIRPLMKHKGTAEWLEVIKEEITSSAISAKNNTFKGMLKSGKGEVKGISKNRRRENCIDNELIVLVFYGENGEKVFLVNFACHPIIVQVQPLISADFVGVVESKIEKIIENTRGCLFLQGACGDINPVKDDTRDFNDVYFTGMTIIGEIIKIFSKMQLLNYPSQPVVLKTLSKKIKFPSRNLPSKREIQKLKIEDPRYYQEVRERIKEGDKEFEGEIHLIRIANILITGIPGEPFCKLGKEIKEKSKPFIGIPAGYTNGYLGYIAPPEVWKKGGYEVRCGPWSKIGEESYDIILKNFEKLRNKLE